MSFVRVAIRFTRNLVRIVFQSGESSKNVLYMAQMLLLAIETSSARGSLALLDGESILREAPFPEGLVHGREVTVHLQRVMAEAGFAPRRLDALAVGLGPGSYTGIRVGVTAAKTLAFALRIPVLAESSLRVIAANASTELAAPGAGAAPGDGVGAGEGSPEGTRTVVAVDGKQKHVYLARYRTGAKGGAGARHVEQELAELAIELPWPPGRERPGGAPPHGGPTAPLSPAAAEVIDEALAPGVVVVGDAADAVLAAARMPGALRGPREWDWPRAAVLGRLAAVSARGMAPRFDLEAVHLLVPIYLRSSEAERRGAAR
jgi:tRNA threonylcarbamoyladenosine biosynthesis protein TsaB